MAIQTPEAQTLVECVYHVPGTYHQQLKGEDKQFVPGFTEFMVQGEDRH